MTSAPHLSILKRVPTQARSIRRVEGILDAAAELLREQEPTEVTIRDLAAGADVPTGTIYQFFDDKDAVLQALALRFLEESPRILDTALSAPSGSWQTTLARVIDGHADLVRGHPAARRLWLSGTVAVATHRVGYDSDPLLAERLGAVLRTQAGTRRGTPAQWRVLVALANALLRHAFTVDPAGDRVALREAHRAACAYAGTILDRPA